MREPVEQIRLANKMLALLLEEVPGDSDRCPPTAALAETAYTEIYDGPSDGAEPVFLRLSVSFPSHRGYADVAAQDWLGQPLLGLQRNAYWEPQRIEALARRLELKVGHWFSYNRRDVALACYDGDRRVYLDGLRSLRAPVYVEETEVVSWFEVLGPDRRSFNTELYAVFRARTTQELVVLAAKNRAQTKSLICDLASSPPECVLPVYQEHPGWCVPATVETVLRYHNVNVTKEDVALALGMDENSSGVDIDFDKVIEVIEDSDSDSLKASLVEGTKWGWKFAQTEIDASPGRPFVAVSGNHARVGAGYGYFSLDGRAVQGLILADPAGGWACWETIDAAGGFGICVKSK